MNRIKKASATINFETESGYKSRAGSQNQPGIDALLWAVDEIGRIMTIDGSAARAREVLDAAINRTQTDLDALAKDQSK